MIKFCKVSYKNPLMRKLRRLFFINKTVCVMNVFFSHYNYYLDTSQIESIELTKEKVKAALTSLFLIHKQNRTVASRKRRRTKSFDRSLENENKKQKQIYSNIILSNVTQAENIVLATSGLNKKQMVSLFIYIINYIFLFFLGNHLETSEKICFTF